MEPRPSSSLLTGFLIWGEIVIFATWSFIQSLCSVAAIESALWYLFTDWSLTSLFYFLLLQYLLFAAYASYWAYLIIVKCSLVFHILRSHYPEPLTGDDIVALSSSKIKKSNVYIILQTLVEDDLIKYERVPVSGFRRWQNYYRYIPPDQEEPEELKSKASP